MTYYSLIAIAALVLLFVVYKRRTAVAYDGMSEDAEVVAKLAEIGSDMSKEHLLEFYFYFPTEEAAESVAAALAEDGYEIESSEATSEQQWSMVVSKRMLPDAAELERLREEFTLLVEPVQGEYDGLGAGIES